MLSSEDIQNNQIFCSLGSDVENIEISSTSHIDSQFKAIKVVHLKYNITEGQYRLLTVVMVSNSILNPKFLVGHLKVRSGH